jgi:hypothetical protein
MSVISLLAMVECLVFVSGLVFLRPIRNWIFNERVRRNRAVHLEKGVLVWSRDVKAGDSVELTPKEIELIVSQSRSCKE